MITVLSSIHPAVSGFSLAFVLLLGWLDGRSFLGSRTLSAEGSVALWALGIALVITFFSGYLTSGFLYPSLDPVLSAKIADHHVIGRWAVIVYPIVGVSRYLAVRRRTLVSAIWYAIVLGVLGSLVICGGRVGGKLVFEHGVGVHRPDSQTAHEAKELQEG